MPDAPPTHPPKSSREEVERTIAEHMLGILEALGCEVSSPGMKDTPQRVARMLVRETCHGLFTSSPILTTFPRVEGERGPVHVTGIAVRSLCEHHLLPMEGWATVSYLPDSEVLGLSKLTRLVHWWASRPQLQERLTLQIQQSLMEHLRLPSVAVSLCLRHACVVHRGVCDDQSMTWTHQLAGEFAKADRWLREAHFHACRLEPALQSQEEATLLPL